MSGLDHVIFSKIRISIASATNAVSDEVENPGKSLL